MHLRYYRSTGTPNVRTHLPQQNNFCNINSKMIKCMYCCVGMVVRRRSANGVMSVMEIFLNRSDLTEELNKIVDRNNSSYSHPCVVSVTVPSATMPSATMPSVTVPSATMPPATMPSP